MMVKAALFVRMEARPGKESEVENLLKNALPLVENEPGTAAWFGGRMGRSSFGIFDAFPDEEGRQAHLAGSVAKELMKRSPELFAGPPVIQEVDVLAAKLPKAGLLKLKTKASKVSAALGVAGIVAAGWYAARRYFGPSTPYEALEKAPVSTPL